MDLCRSLTVCGGELTTSQEQLFSSSCSKLGTTASLDDLFSSYSTTEGDVGLEWLSIYVEDCFSSSGSCLPPAALSTEIQNKPTFLTPKALPQPHQQQINTTRTSCLQDLVIPGKARSKRKRRSPLALTQHKNRAFCPSPSDPPLLHLHQAYWLADSELILPKKDEETHNRNRDRDGGDDEEKEEEKVGEIQKEKKKKKKKKKMMLKVEGQGRRCSHCLAQRTPQWRAGPMGPKTLCNACGVRYKSGRLLPEYRPAKSPTFVSYKHSNSHKKVLEMRNMALLSPATVPHQL